MSAALRHRAEVLKLARLLDVEPDTLPDLSAVDAESLREFRERATDRLFDASAALLGPVGSASTLVPSGIAATIAERAFGPLLCARVAAAVPPSKAVDIARRLSGTFLADVAIALDPRRVAAIISAVPPAMSADVARILGERGEHVTMGRFLGFIDDDGLLAAMAGLDDESMLRTAFVLEHPQRLDHAVSLLPPDRMPGILRTASALDLWPEALGLIGHLSPRRAGTVADQLPGLDEADLAGLVAAVAAADLWEALAPLVAQMSTPARERLLASPALGEHVHRLRSEDR